MNKIKVFNCEPEDLQYSINEWQDSDETINIISVEIGKVKYETTVLVLYNYGETQKEFKL